MFRNIRAAISFLTRIPAHANGEFNMSAALPWFPFVGTLIGTIAGTTYVGLHRIAPPQTAAALTLVVSALITGAFHHDGLADIADAFGGGWTIEQRLTILKDSRHGTYGVVALTLNVLVQWSALSTMSCGWAFASLICAHTVGRTAILAVLLWAKPATADGLGNVVGLRRARTVVGLLLGVIVSAVAFGGWSPLALLGAATTTSGLIVLSKRKIGGYSGDVLGATEQLAECAVLAIGSALAMRYAPWWQ